MATVRELGDRCGSCLLFGAIQGLEDGVVLADTTGNVFLLNRRAEQILGLAGADAVGSRLMRVLRHPGLVSLWSSADGETGTVTAEVVLPSGATVRASVSACVAVDGQQIGRALLLRDVTRERRVQVDLSASVARRLVEMAGGDPAQEEMPSLTQRELEILGFLGEGLSNAGIAEKLRVAPSTVASHLKHLFPKIQVKNRSQAAAYAVARGVKAPRGARPSSRAR